MGNRKVLGGLFIYKGIFFQLGTKGARIWGERAGAPSWVMLCHGQDSLSWILCKEGGAPPV